MTNITLTALRHDEQVKAAVRGIIQESLNKLSDEIEGLRFELVDLKVRNAQLEETVLSMRGGNR